jgi:O-antigen/teichoic acid export membrane protein
MTQARTRQGAAELDILDSDRAGGVFLRGGSLRALAYAGAVAASVAAIPLVSRHLHAVGYGRYVTVTSLLLIAAALTEGGIANLGVREFSDDKPFARREFMRNLIGVRLALSGAGAVGAIAFALLASYPTVVVEGTAIASLGLVLANLQVTLAVPLTAGLRLTWLGALDLIGPVTTAGALIALSPAGASLLPFFAAALAGYTATLLITAALVHGELTLWPAFSVRGWRTLLSDSFVFAAATALGAIYFQVVVVAMSVLTSGRQVGIFSLAFRVLSVVNGVPLVLVGSAFAILLRAARTDRERLRYAVQRLLEANLLLGGAISLVVIAAAPLEIRVLGGNAYLGSVTVLRILGAGITATFLAVVFAFTLLSLRRYRTLIVINAAMVALAVVLCATLVPADGARGAAIATLSLELLLALSYGVAVITQRPELRPRLPVVGRTLLALGAGFAVALALPLPSVAATACGCGVLVGAVGTLGLFPRELVDALKPGRS